MSYSDSIDPSMLLTQPSSNFDQVAKILLIGETGAGKSTLINYLVNYFYKGNLSNLKVAIPCKHHPLPTEHFSHDELNIHDNTQSKTSTCTQYIFTDPATNRQYLFLDTPGLCDTRGHEQNESNMTNILNATTELGNLTSVIIVINGSTSRLTMHLRTVIACLNGHIPDVILENVIVILTNVKKYESPFDLKVLNLHGKVYPFYMQNGAFVSDPQTWKKSIRDELQYDWDHSMNQIRSIIQTIDSFKQVSIDSFIQLREIRNEIKSIMHQVRLEMAQIQKIQDQLSQVELALKEADQDTIKYQDHTRVQTVEKVALVDAAYHSTLCGTCNQVCHNNCRLNETRAVGAQIFSQCIVMIDGRCLQCRNHCSYKNHYHAKKTIRITQESLLDVLTDLKTKYDQAYTNRNHYQEQMLTISETKQILEKALKEKVHEMKLKSLKLCHICSSFDLAKEFHYLIEQFHVESNLIQNLEVRLQTDRIIQNLIKFTRLIEENQEKRRQQRPPMQIIDREQSMEKTTPDIRYMKTVDLINLYHQITDHCLITSILNELHQRAQGKSTSPLLTSDEIMIINKNLEKYKHQTIQQLSYSYRKLQQQIHSIINSDILKIVNVNPELLIENFIVQTLLDNKEKNQSDINEDDAHFEMTPRSFPHPMINSFPQPHFATTSQALYPPPYPNTGSVSSQPGYPFPYPDTRRRSFQATSQSVYPPAPCPNSGLLLSQSVYPPAAPTAPSKSLEGKTSNISVMNIGFSHLSFAPYPSLNNPSPMPALPDHFSPIIQHDKPQSSVHFRLNDYRYDATDTKSNTSSFDYQQYMPMPMPMPASDQQQSTYLRNSNTESSSNHIREQQQHVTSATERASQPDVIPFSTDLSASSKSHSKYLRHNKATSFDSEDLHLLDTSVLLSMYTDANLKENESRREAIYHELQRRCYGEYPMLMTEKKSLLQEKISFYEMKAMKDLIRAQISIIGQIQEYLKYDDVTLINEIPAELIVEVNALNQLILSKSTM